MEISKQELLSGAFENGEEAWACVYNFDNIENTHATSHIKPTKVQCFIKKHPHYDDNFAYDSKLQPLGKNGKPLKRLFGLMVLESSEPSANARRVTQWKLTKSSSR